MAEFVAAAGKAERSTLNAAIAPRGFPPLQLRHGAINADAESAGAGVAKNPENFLLPFPFLEEVVDDEIRAQFKMLSPASMEPGEQFAAVRIECQAQPGTSPMLTRCMAFIDVFKRGASIVGLTGNQTPEVAALQLHETDRIEFVRNQKDDVIERDAGE
jgi:hypothetical protein